ncbi:hypothetical protein ACYFX5_07580 [Bremerella sp. T1]|uniref:hypothetical protein n=1 Tax=Bremerella sp. TYQ1 TaxID=3119568 RepID=UPI001CCA763E|nr:hypothetical protein [Bremerella volcania]UBM38117.1 hypothetical protein LA756_09515 [Bremerella volcania]
MTPDSWHNSDPPPCFSLWALASAMAMCGVVFAVLRLLGPFAAFMTILFLAVALVHLGASYLSLRLGLKRRRNDRNPPTPGERVPPPALPRKWKASNLAERSGLSAKQIHLMTQATLAGGILGASASTWLPAHQFNAAVLGVCLISGAALCGMGCFVLSNLIEHAWRALASARHADCSQPVE